MSQNREKTTRPANSNRRAGSMPTAAALSRELAELRQKYQERVASLTESNRQLKRKIFDLYTIFEISRNFNAVLDFQQLLDTFIFTSMAQVGSMKAAIYLEHGIHDNFFVAVKQKGSGGFPPQDANFYNGTTVVEYLSKLNRPARTGELLEGVAGEKDKLILDKFHPGVVVPLVYQGELIGLLLIAEKMSGREFTNDDIEFLSILGNQISVAIQNTRLYEAEKEMSQQLRSTQEQLVHSERLAALGEMSAKVAHEINNPLGIIKNYMLLTKQESAGNAAAENYLKIVGQEIDRIARIVRELLDFHRPTTMDIKDIDAAEVIREVLILMERQLEKQRVKLITNFSPDSPRISASPENLKQVFLNIVINALDAMEHGGALTVSVQSENADLVIQFSDTGTGIPPELIPRIFEPFFSTKKPGKGTGLGLSVCYGIVKKHKGTISFRNLDTGGCFEIRLPIKESNGSLDYAI